MIVIRKPLPSLAIGKSSTSAIDTGAADPLLLRNQSLLRFACLLYSELQEKMSTADIYAMLDEAVLLEKAFFSGEPYQPHLGRLLSYTRQLRSPPHSLA